jgi:hypothetical protein
MALRENREAIRVAEQRRADAQAGLAAVDAQFGAQDSVRELARQKLIQSTERLADLVGDE